MILPSLEMIHGNHSFNVSTVTNFLKAMGRYIAPTKPAFFNVSTRKSVYTDKLVVIDFYLVNPCCGEFNIFLSNSFITVN